MINSMLHQASTGFLFTFLLIICGCSDRKNADSHENSQDPTTNADTLIQQRLYHLLKADMANGFPRVYENGNVVYTPAHKWTSGFFPGNLWLSYQYTGDEAFKAAAESWMPLIEDQQYNTVTHDIGFMIYCSVGNAYKITGKEKYKEVIIQAAKSLSTRYSERIEAIRSFDPAQWHSWDYPVIIDNMMNLELLFAGTRLTGDSSYANIAIKHALTTIKDHYRDDYSSYHVVDYNEDTGGIIKKQTFQGYADESSWSRGQSWGLYGFTVCYRETGDERFLDQARNIAAYLMHHPNMPADKVPYWDYNAPDIPGAPRDASASAVLASALLELSHLAGDTDYKNYANEILGSLKSKEYLLPSDSSVPFVLDHSTGFLPKPEEKEIDVPLVYADYYFLEALVRGKEFSSP